MTTKSPLRRFLTIKETAKYTSLAESTLYKMVSRREIPHLKMGRLVKFDLAMLEKWIKERTVMPMPERRT